MAGDIPKGVGRLRQQLAEKLVESTASALGSRQQHRRLKSRRFGRPLCQM